jgi:hypothetical protein
MGGFLAGVLLCTLTSTVAEAACDMSLDPAGQMEWCSRDHGFNEGATCGLNALGNTGINGLPAMVSQAVLGNTWDRTNMMGAAKAAYRAGHQNEAVTAALCCQIHNPDYSKLQECRSQVAAWLAR